MLLKHYFIRAIDFKTTFEDFFVSAIVAILGVRIFLSLTSYPQLGGGGLHIAHILWGGILMLAALILLLAFLGRSIRRPAAILGGLGFGIFIDELGKFITRDNNYFFQPTFSLIYIFFVLLYLAIDWIEKCHHFSSKEYLVNSLDYLKEAVIKDLDADEKKLALHYLVHANQESPVTQALERLYEKLDAIPVRQQGLITRFQKSLRKFYFRLVEKKWFGNAVNVFFVLKFIVGLFLILSAVIVIVNLILSGGVTLQDFYGSSIEVLDFVASAVVGVFIALGIIKMRKSRLEGYQMFRLSILVSIFLIQVFAFYQDQLGAFTGLIFNLLVLTTLNYMIKQEQA